MPTPLHDIDALRSLAVTETPVLRDWATARLAIAGERIEDFASLDEASMEVAIASNPPGLLDGIARRLQTGPVTPAVASSIAALGAYGALPADTDSLIDMLGSAEPADADAGLWLAYGRALLGALDLEALAAVRSDSPAARWVMPAMVLRVADDLGRATEAAAEIAGQLDDASAVATLAALGGHFVPSPSKDIGEAAMLGAVLAGAEPVPLRPGRGSRRLRAARAVDQLLAEADGPAAALLRAYSHSRDVANPAWLVASAAWLAAFVPSDDPVDDVLLCGAGADGVLLSAARRDVVEEHRPAIHDSFEHSRHVGVLALEVADEALADRLARRLAEDPNDLRGFGLAAVAAARNPDLIPKLLSEPLTRDVAFTLASWAPTEEVLTALLATPVPHRPESRGRFTSALASMADRAAVPTLAALAAKYPKEDDVAAGVALAEALLGSPVA